MVAMATTFMNEFKHASLATAFRNPSLDQTLRQFERDPGAA